MKFVRIFDHYINPDNVSWVEPIIQNGSGKEIGTVIMFNSAMDHMAMRITVNFGKNDDGTYKHTTSQIVNALEKGIDLVD